LNEFKQGSFTQTIDGLLYLYRKPNNSNKAAGATAADRATLGIEVTNESGALSTSRINPDTGDLYTPIPGSRAQSLVGAGLSPNTVSAGAGRGTNAINPSAINSAAAADGARGQSSAVPVPPVNVGSGNGAPDVFNAAPPGPKDTVAPSNPPKPPTDGIGGQNLSGPPLPIPATTGRVTPEGLSPAPTTPQDVVYDY
jgi:hypothetical protein